MHKNHILWGEEFDRLQNMEYTVEEPVISNRPKMARRNELTDFFTQPQSTAQRRYEVCRAYFLERQTDRQIAQPSWSRLGRRLGLGRQRRREL